MAGTGNGACGDGHGKGDAPLVLVIEDGLLVAMEIEDALLAEGLAVQIADSLSSARAAIRNVLPAAALVDCRLADGHAYDIALHLHQRGCRVALVTGMDPSVLPPALQILPRFGKPVPARILVRWVRQALFQE